MRLEPVQNAADHARTVAAWIMGKPVRCEAVSLFWTEQGARKLQIAGLVDGYDTAVTIGIMARRPVARSGSLPSPAEERQKIAGPSATEG